MKPVIHAVLALLTLCSAHADNVTVQSCALKSSLPVTKYLLDQPPVASDGKTATIPYLFCGALNEQDIKKYCKFPDPRRATSTTILPNGATCHVKALSSPADGELKVKIKITQPKSGLTEAETSVHLGQGLLIRCQTGSDPKKARVFVLKINKQNG